MVRTACGDYSPGKVIKRFRKFTLAWDLPNSRRLLTRQSAEGFPPGEQRFGDNPEYLFHVGRKGEAAYQLESARRHSDPLGKQGFSTPRNNLKEYAWYLEAGCRIWGVPLLELIDSPEFRMTTCEPAQDGLVRVGFEYLRTERGNFRSPTGTTGRTSIPQNSGRC